MKKISRQRKWQLKQTAAGRCTICGQPIAAGSKFYCEKHWKLSRNRGFVSARNRAGIPLDAPKYKHYNKYRFKLDKLPL